MQSKGLSRVFSNTTKASILQKFKSISSSKIQKHQFFSAQLSLPRSEVKSLSRVRLFATLWTVAHQAPLSMGFSRQEYWSGLPFPSPGALPDPGMEPGSPELQTDSLPSEPPGKIIYIKAKIMRYLLCQKCGPQATSLMCTVPHDVSVCSSDF